jgi:hypothetical protein
MSDLRLVGVPPLSGVVLFFSRLIPVLAPHAQMAVDRQRKIKKDREIER